MKLSDPCEDPRAGLAAEFATSASSLPPFHYQLWPSDAEEGRNGRRGKQMGLLFPSRHSGNQEDLRQRFLGPGAGPGPHSSCSGTLPPHTCSSVRQRGPGGQRVRREPGGSVCVPFLWVMFYINRGVQLRELAVLGGTDWVCLPPASEEILAGAPIS